MRSVFILLISIFLFHTAKAQFDITAELRPRAEVRNGYKHLRVDDNDPAVFVSQRSRIVFGYQKKNLRMKLSVQDVRVWGDEEIASATGHFGDYASLDLNEAWIEFDFLKYSSMRVGRQYFAYDDYRLLFKRNWNQQSMPYDAILYKFEHPVVNVDVALSWNNTKENLFGNLYPTDRIKTTNFIHLNKKWNENLETNMIALFSGYEKTDSTETIYVRNTFGIYTMYNPGNFSFKASSYYQTGKNKMGVDVQAYLIAAEASRKIIKTRIKIGGAIVSGNKPGDDNNFREDNLFDLLYGARHRYFGLMDYFSNMGKGTANAGLTDIYTGISRKITENTELTLDYHYFLLSQEIFNDSKTLPRSLGSEIDLYFSWNVSQDVKLQGGYSFILPDETLEFIQGVETENSRFSYWGWVMLTVKPVLFKE